MTTLRKPTPGRNAAVELYATELGGPHGQGAGPSTQHAYVAIVAPGLSWAAAREEAIGLGKTLGGHWDLATITSAAEQRVVNAMLGPRAPRDEFWLGAFQPAGEERRDANWQWIDGQPWNYENWAPGEPNDAFGPAGEQQLGEFGTGMWNDEGWDSNITGFIAEGDEPVK